MKISKLTIEITSGENSCTYEPLQFCKYVRYNSNTIVKPTCIIFNKDLYRNNLGGIERLEECKKACKEEL